MLADLWLPIVASAVALFFASFLSWVVAPIHRKDWVKIDRENEFLNVLGELEMPPGSYMFPGLLAGHRFARRRERGDVALASHRAEPLRIVDDRRAGRWARPPYTRPGRLCFDLRRCVV